MLAELLESWTPCTFGFVSRFFSWLGDTAFSIAKSINDLISFCLLPQLHVIAWPQLYEGANLDRSHGPTF